MELLKKKRRGIDHHEVTDMPEFLPLTHKPQSLSKKEHAEEETMDSHVHGHKRKIGCIDNATRVSEKKIEQDYVFGREIGGGKFGSVRVCSSRATGVDFACKTLRKGEETFHREVEIMQHLSGHPGVVEFKAVYEDLDSFHLVMELCSGGRLLDQMAKEGKHSEHRAANVLKELMSVVKYCHEIGVVHRDIKPENILLTTSGKIKLADFGLAMRISNGQELCGVVGSPAYVAPEVLVGNYTEKADIWSVGVILHTLLVGERPFKGKSQETLFEAIKTMELDFQNGKWESISPSARDLISRMLSRDVSARLTADQVLRHPWILFHTELTSWNPSLIVSSYERPVQKKSEKQEEGDLVDALAMAISRIKISESEGSRHFRTPIIQRSRMSPLTNMNANINLCTAV